jgi:hypothetical protein
VAIRVGDWKAVYLENRAQQLAGLARALRPPALPLLFNLRRDPFEKSQHNSNTYHDWMIDRAFVLVPLQAVASKFLLTLKDYPPSQTPGDWSLDSLEKQIKGNNDSRCFAERGGRDCLCGAPVAGADPLPSWNDTASRRAIVEFVEKVTQEGSP